MVKLPQGAVLTDRFDESRALQGPRTKPLGVPVLAAIVTIDKRKMDPECAALWGMQQVTGQFREMARRMGDASHSRPYAEACYKLALMLGEEDDKLQVELTKAAERCGAATVQHLKNGQGL